MPKKRIYHIIEWIVALAACGYLVWRLATYDDYESLWACLRAMGWKEWCALGLCVALMPVNMALEAWKWKTLLPMSWHDAHLQVYYSKLAGVITPWRLGEYPARGVLMNERVKELKNEGDVWKKVLSMGAVGSATMTAAIVSTGVIAMIMDKGQWTMDGIQWTMGNVQYWIYVGAVILLLILFLALAPRILRRWAEVSHRLVLVTMGQSFVRLLCWCVQLYLVLWALGALTGYGLPVTGAKTFVYYLLVTVTPNVPIAEVGVRGVWAITVFGTMNAAFAGVLLWVINTLLPCVVWPFLKKNQHFIQV